MFILGPTVVLAAWARAQGPGEHLLIKDINPTPVATNMSSEPRGFLTVGGLAFFHASTPGRGRELYHTPGFNASLVQDIWPGSHSALPAATKLVGHGSRVFFSARDGIHGHELWSADGSSASLVKDLNPGLAQSLPELLTVFRGSLYFVATGYVGANNVGRELWRTDGTAAGTVLAADIVSGPGSSNPLELTVVGNTLFFVATHKASRWLFKTTGTRTQGVARIGSGAWELKHLTASGNTLFFAGNDGTHGYELWKSDGTASGTVMVKDLRLGLSVGSDPSRLVGVRLNGTDMVYFTADDGWYGRELWWSDGTPAGTRFFDIQKGPWGSHPSELTFAASVNPPGLYFSAWTNATGRELFRLVNRQYWWTDLWKGSGSSTPSGLTVVNNRLYFSANDGVLGQELWTYGSSGASLVRDIAFGGDSSNPRDIARFGDDVIFSAADSQSDREPWRTGGLFGPFRLANLYNILHRTADSDPKNLAAGFKEVFFAASDPYRGIEPWRSDGTETGTKMIDDLYRGSAGSNPSGFAVGTRDTFFVAGHSSTGTELFSNRGLKLDLFPGYRGSDPTWLTPVGNGLVFVATTAQALSAVDTELHFVKYSSLFPYHHDVVDIWSGPQGSHPRDLTRLGDLVVFAADDGTNGTEPWVTDATAAGTRRLADIFPGVGTSGPTEFTACGRNVFFAAASRANEMELWRTDGTPRGTAMVKDINPSGASAPAKFVSVGRILYFVASDGQAGRELWRSDGTANGTFMVKDIYTGGGSSGPDKLTVSGDLLFFVAGHPVHGFELWRSDGTAAGTRIVKDLVPGAASPFVHELRSFGDRNVLCLLERRLPSGAWGTELYATRGTAPAMSPIRTSTLANSFRLLGRVGSRRFLFAFDDRTSGYEMFETDGIPNNTRVIDVWRGPGGSVPREMAMLKGNVVFAARDRAKGRELFAWNPGAVAYPVGLGCGTPTPKLEVSDPRVSRSADLALSDLSPLGIYQLAIGPPANTPISLPGTGGRCWIYTATVGTLTVPLRANSVGTWRTTVPIPNDKTMIGLHLVTQAVRMRLFPTSPAELSNPVFLQFGR